MIYPYSLRCAFLHDGADEMNISTVSGGTSSEITCFSTLAAPQSLFQRTLDVMQILASNGLGLGEVLRDYAEQTAAQMTELAEACQALQQGALDARGLQVLKHAHFILTSAATVLEMTPAAMARNKAEMVGGREKISREEIVRVARQFREAPEIHGLMESEASSIHLLQQALAAPATELQ